MRFCDTVNGPRIAHDDGAPAAFGARDGGRNRRIRAFRRRLSRYMREASGDDDRTRCLGEDLFKGLDRNTVPGKFRKAVEVELECCANDIFCIRRRPPQQLHIVGRFDQHQPAPGGESGPFSGDRADPITRWPAVSESCATIKPIHSRAPVRSTRIPIAAMVRATAPHRCAERPGSPSHIGGSGQAACRNAFAALHRR